MTPPYQPGGRPRVTMRRVVGLSASEGNATEGLLRGGVVFGDERAGFSCADTCQGKR